MGDFMKVVGWVVVITIIGGAVGLYDVRVCVKDVGKCDCPVEAQQQKEDEK